MGNRSQKTKLLVLGIVTLLLIALSGIGGDSRIAQAHRVALAEGATGVTRISPLTRELVFPASSLGIDPGSTIITPVYDGLQWAPKNAAAILVIPRPVDWNGTGDILMRIFFRPTTDTAGTVQFFVRPRVYDPGDTFHDVTGIESNEVTVSQAGRYGEFDMLIPAARFGTKSWWYFVIQRNTVGPTYPDDVVIISVAVRYVAVSPLSNAFLPHASNR